MAQQQYLQPQQSSMPNLDENSFGGENSTYDTQEQELLKLQLDVKDLLDDFEHRVLRGEYKAWNAKTCREEWTKYDKTATPMINEIGIRELLSRIIGRVSKAAKLTYKTDEEIYKDMFYFDMSITELIAKRSDAWEMGEEMAKAIKDAAVELVWDIVASSRNGFTAINIRSQYSRSDVTRMDGSQKEGKSFLGFPLGGK